MRECLNRTCWHTLESVPYTLDRQCQWQLSMYYSISLLSPNRIFEWPLFKKSNLNPCHPCRGCSMPSLVELGSVVLEKMVFIISSMYFRYFALISIWKRTGVFIWTLNLNSLYPKDCFVAAANLRYLLLGMLFHVTWRRNTKCGI